ncbi:Mth938-like domain-containing protein [Aquincola tertiaricarbonis]|uniref:Mth938-like domain-containing protein n=1 Tax=Aquincola tertiaricarbonis TaxID=391953 RepID=A0ABY4SBZ1_AQUTE|nr:Mth938-like domain-containing protein [Aquincola tertiaricarbonis]URI08825.1 Mth938-like domain-containing protein [Aquincola tertiaricarbonis]
MKFQPDHLEGVNSISRVEPGRLWVNGSAYTASVLVPWRGQPVAWPVADVPELTAAHFEQVLALQPELVIFGSGTRLRFVSPALQRALIERRIGVETMDTPAACRTYNVLASEGRSVVAALLLQPQ